MHNRGISRLGIAVAIAGILVVGGGGYILTRPVPVVAPTVQQPKEIRWLMGRTASPQFQRAVATFSDVLSKETNASLIVRVVKPQDIGLVSEDATTAETMDLLQSGAIEMGTLSAVSLGADRPAFWALGMPYLFDTYAQADRAFESDITTRIFTTLDDSPVRALALTYSGGFRVIATKNIAIKSTRDLAGARIVTSGGLVEAATLRSFGATPVQVSSSTADSIAEAIRADGIETTYDRLGTLGEYGKVLHYINETNASLSASVIVIRSDLFVALQPAQQEAVKKAARAAAMQEREDTIAAASTTRAALATQGMTIVEIPQKLRDALRALTLGVAPSFASTTDPEIIHGLQSVR